jgi:hypothetical protein
MEERQHFTQGRAQNARPVELFDTETSENPLLKVRRFGDVGRRQSFGEDTGVRIYLILRHAWIHIVRPGRDATREVKQVAGKA